MRLAPGAGGRLPGSRYVDAVTSDSYTDLLLAVASSGGALTGLLFVAMSVVIPRREVAQGPRIIQQIRAAASMLAFSNALTVSLFGLVPGTNVGYPSATLGVIGLFFSAASLRSIRTSNLTGRQQRQQFHLLVLLLAIFGTELGAGIAAIASPAQSTPADLIGYALVTSLIVGIARAWEFVGDIDTGLVASLAVLVGRQRVGGPAAADPAADPRRSGDSGAAS